MYKIITSLFTFVLFAAICSCGQPADKTDGKESATEQTTSKSSEREQVSISDDESQKNIMRIAEGSEDHSTLETAIKAAEMSHVLENPGPLTVFAPTNAAFDKLPEGTVESLLEPENKAKLKNIIEYHAAPGSYGPDNISGVEGIGQANMEKVEVTKKDGETYVNGNQVIASVKASNGWVHVIDGVLLPPEE